MEVDFDNEEEEDYDDTMVALVNIEVEDVTTEFSTIGESSVHLILGAGDGVVVPINVSVYV